MSTAATGVSSGVEVEEKERPELRSPSTSSRTTLSNDLPKVDQMVESTVRIVPASEEVPFSVFTTRQKWLLVSLASLAGLFSPLSANIYFPAIPSIAKELHVTTERVNLTVTVFMVFQAISPTFWSAICDVLGRRPVFLGTFTVYIGACIGLANTRHYWLLLTLRCLQAFGSASTIAAGAGLVADVASPSSRGGFMGLFGMGAMLGPCLGPTIGALITQAYDWRAMFALLSAWAGIPLILIVLFLPETLRSIVGNGSHRPESFINRPLLAGLRPKAWTDEDAPLNRKTWRDINVLSTLMVFREKDVLLLLFFNSISYALFYCVTTSTSVLFADTYGLSVAQVGLCYLAFGGGCVVSSALNGIRLNSDFRTVSRQVYESIPSLNTDGEPMELKKLSAAELKEKMAKLTGGLEGFPIERARLRSIPYFFFALITSTIIYGWTVRSNVSIAIPLICQFVIGVTSTSIGNAVSTLLLDLWPAASASVTAANNLCRCSMGAVGTSVIDLILARMGSGWTFTLLSLLTALTGPLLIIEWVYGMRMRKARLDRLARKTQKPATSRVK